MSAPVYLLGISCYGHDASAALLRDGNLFVTFEEERFSREKHSSRFPIQAIRNCLEFAEIGLEQVAMVTFYMKPWLELSGNFAHIIRYFPRSLKLFLGEFGGGAKLGPLERVRKMLFVRDEFRKHFPGKTPPKIRFVEHHLAHAASCFFLSRFDSAAILTLDAKGESTSTLFARGCESSITKIDEFHVPHSIGLMYAAITDFLGFRPFFDEWRVMGMSAYGAPKYESEFSKIISFNGTTLNIDLEYFRYHLEGAPNWVSSKFFEVFGPARRSGEPIDQRHYDVACSLQRTIESVVLALAIELRKRTHEKYLCIAGGVAFNILANAKLVSESGFDEIFFQPIAGDAGTSFGSALYVCHSELKAPRKMSFDSVYLGLEYLDTDIELELKQRSLQYDRTAEPWDAAARAIASGEVVGWFQGRMEAGPRALGNRSILADPRRAEMKEILNERIKRREAFRPFAPSVCEEDVHRYFEMPKNVLSPYMMVSGKTRAEHRTALAAVTHEDGSARVHTVSKSTNPNFWKLLKAFEAISGIPVVLNTSFNENEPIVENPAQAIDCFLRTKMDRLIIGNFVVRRAGP